jgi:hypothetical protein
VAVSLDGGDSWSKVAPPGSREWRGPEAGAFERAVEEPERIVRWVEPIAWDSAGALYYLWSEGREILLGRSVDYGVTWETMLVTQSEDLLFYPYLAANGAGELAATWHSGYGPGLGVHVAYIRLSPDSGSLEKLAVEELPFESLGPWGPDRQPTAAILGEYKPVIFLRDGGLAVITPIFEGFENRWGFRYHRVEVKRP